MRIACVVHRYGPQATGGSEAHCRAIALRLAERHDVTVLTSCAVDYVTWASALPAGESRDERVRVLRFPVQRTRHLNRFRELSERVFADRASEEEQRAWFAENGPRVPELLDHLSDRGRDYDRVLFWAFRYYPSFFGVRLVSDRAVLVPTAEDDELIRSATILGSFFAQPRAYLFLTPEEQALVAAHSQEPLRPSAVIGAGLDPVSHKSDRAILDRLRIADPFLLYLGRIDRNKGCDRLLELFTTFFPGGNPDLVFAGPGSLHAPHHPHVRHLGFVDAPTREALLSYARALVMPSRYESLSLVVLEAWNHGTPVLVNGACKPLRGQVMRANGGLYYDLPGEFAETARFLATHADIAQEFGKNGLAYVDREYRWPLVLAKVESILAGEIRT
jgi:glycosyltransferase involved in cell wall biosynthesis